VEPVFLELGEVLLIHQDQLERYGGTAGIRDIRLPESAVSMPRAGIADRYLHEDIFQMAAAYLYYIVKDHPFVDGNKRTGTVAALVFLTMNDVEVVIDEGELEKMARTVAEGSKAKAEVATFFRENTRS